MSRFAISARFLWYSTVHRRGSEATNASLTRADPGQLPAALTVTRAVGGVVIAALWLLGYGAAGSYRSIERLVVLHHVSSGQLKHDFRGSTKPGDATRQNSDIRTINVRHVIAVRLPGGSGA